MPAARLAERVWIAVRITSGLVAGKFDGLIASMNCRAWNFSCSLVFSSTCACSTKSVNCLELSR